MCKKNFCLEKPPPGNEKIVVFPYMDNKNVKPSIPYDYQGFHTTKIEESVSKESIDIFLTEMSKLPQYKDSCLTIFIIIFLILFFPVGIILIAVDDSQRENQLHEIRPEEHKIIHKHNGALKKTGWQWHHIPSYTRRESNEPNYFMLEHVGVMETEGVVIADGCSYDEKEVVEAEMVEVKP